MMEGSGGGAALCEGLYEGDLGGGLLYWGTLKMRFLRDIQMPCKQASLSIGALLGKMEGVLLPEILREKKSISGFLSWTRRSLRF
jgi:hypothetical protein